MLLPFQNPIISNLIKITKIKKIKSVNIRNGFTFPVPAYPCYSGKEAFTV